MASHFKVDPFREKHYAVLLKEPETSTNSVHRLKEHKLRKVFEIPA